ncbi:MAG: MFS transporter [Anaerolineae bacterium]
MNKPTARRKYLGRLERNIFVLGWVSFFTDASTEMIYPLLPLFLSNVLGAPTTVIGLIEGVAESTASLLKVFSGWFSDRIGRRKELVLAGYGLSNVVKPMLSLATTWPHVFLIRFTDRLGKGVRTSPRDAIIADSAPAAVRGSSFGFHRAMDTAGAAAGPLTAFLLLPLLQGNYRHLFFLSLIPGAIAVALVAILVREKGPRDRIAAELPRLSLKPFNRQFKLFLLAVLFFTLGNSSDAFLILRAQNAGVTAALIPLLWLLFNMVYSLSSWPAGILSDRVGRRALIVSGYLIFALVYLGFALVQSAWQVWGLFVLYGLYYGATEGVQRAYAADLVPAHLRGTAYGIYHTATGLALFPASFVAGVLWQTVGVFAPFVYGASMALGACLIFITLL